MRKLVLLADGDEDTRLIYSMALKHFGYSVLEASTGSEALELIRTRKPGVVVAGCTPDIPGCRWVRRIPADTSIVVVTTDGRPECRDQAYDAGCDALLLKPVSPTQLVTTLTALSRSGHHKVRHPPVF